VTAIQEFAHIPSRTATGAGRRVFDDHAKRLQLITNLVGQRPLLGDAQIAACGDQQIDEGPPRRHCQSQRLARQSDPQHASQLAQGALAASKKATDAAVRAVLMARTQLEQGCQAGGVLKSSSMASTKWREHSRRPRAGCRPPRRGQTALRRAQTAAQRVRLRSAPRSVSSLNTQACDSGQRR